MNGNPVYSTPVDLQFAEAMQKVAMRVHLGLYEDETAALSHWHIAETHYLEAWSDVRAEEGRRALAGAEKSGYALLRAYWTSPGAASGNGTIAARLPAPAAAPAS